MLQETSRATGVSCTSAKRVPTKHKVLKDEQLETPGKKDQARNNHLEN